MLPIVEMSILILTNQSEFNIVRPCNPLQNSLQIGHGVVWQRRQTDEKNYF